MEIENNNNDTQQDVNATASAENSTQDNINILGGGSDNADTTKQSINLINENSTPEEIAEFYTALGRPEAADKYEINKPEDLPANIAWQDDELTAFKQVAFDSGLSQKQAHELVKFQTEMVKRAIEAQTKAHNELAEKTLATLQKEYGANFDSNIAQANKAMEVFGLQKVFTEANLLANEDVVRAMVKIGASISESRYVDGQNPASSAAKYEELINNPNSAYYNAADPKHAEAVKTVMNFLNTKK